jgi:hypothetical protein
VKTRQRTVTVSISRGGENSAQRSPAGAVKAPDRYGMVVLLPLTSFLATAVLSSSLSRIVTLLL